jgi:hypothetical protein
MKRKYKKIKTKIFEKLIVLIQINHKLHATISPVYYLTFIYCSTCFGRPHAHHLEPNNCSSSLWFLPSYRGDSRAVVRVRTGYEPATAVVGLMMMGVRMPEAC